MESLHLNLQRYCRSARPEWRQARIDSLRPLSNGWESDVYAFDLDLGSEQRPLVLRLYAGQADAAAATARREHAGLAALHSTGYPVPQAMVAEPGPAALGRPFLLMERVEGQLLWPLLFKASDHQPEYLTRFCQAFVDLHRLDWRPFASLNEPFAPDDPFAFIDNALAQAHSFLVQFDFPFLLPYVNWLAGQRQQMACSRPSTVHMDFHPNNVLVRADGSFAIIDWTQIGVSDSRFDLAWSLVLISSYVGAAWGERILREYQRLAPTPVQGLAGFEVFACARRLASILVSLDQGPEAMGMRPEAAGLIRQQLGPARQVYERLVARTGISSPEIQSRLQGS